MAYTQYSKEMLPTHCHSQRSKRVKMDSMAWVSLDERTMAHMRTPVTESAENLSIPEQDTEGSSTSHQRISEEAACVQYHSRTSSAGPLSRPENHASSEMLPTPHQSTYVGFSQDTSKFQFSTVKIEPGTQGDCTALSDCRHLLEGNDSSWIFSPEKAEPVKVEVRVKEEPPEEEPSVSDETKDPLKEEEEEHSHNQLEERNAVWIKEEPDIKMEPEDNDSSEVGGGSSCDVRPASVTSLDHMKPEMEATHRTDSYSCKDCTSTFKYIAELRDHESREHDGTNTRRTPQRNAVMFKVIPEEGTKPLKCRLCSATFYYYRTLNSHMFTQHGPKSNSKRPLEHPTTPSQPPSNIVNENQPWFCSTISSTTFYYLPSLNQHLVTSYQSQVHAESTVGGNAEEKGRTQLKEEEEEHSHNQLEERNAVWIKEEPDIKMEPEDIDSSEVGGASSGDVRPASVVSLDHMKRGMEATHGTDSYSCKDCTSTFKYIAELRDHESRQHAGTVEHRTTQPNAVESTQEEGTKALKCLVCGANFFYQRSLKKHILTQHREESDRYLHCSFSRRPSERPTRSRAPTNVVDKNQPLFCNICSAKFYYARSLKKHLVTRHLNEVHAESVVCGDTEEMGTICQHCSYKFATYSLYYQHLTLLEAQGPHCELCGVSFGTRNALAEHVVQIHTKRYHGPKNAPRADQERQAPPPDARHATFSC